jgi:hypothetical protein
MARQASVFTPLGPVFVNETGTRQAGLAGVMLGETAGTSVTSASVAATEATDTTAISATVTTGAGIAASDSSDTAAINAAIWTTAQVGASDSPDTASLASSVTTGAGIAATDSSDTAAITADANPGVTSASITATDSTDITALAVTVTTGSDITTADSPDLVTIAADAGNQASTDTHDGGAQIYEHHRQRAKLVDKKRREQAFDDASLSDQLRALLVPEAPKPQPKITPAKIELPRSIRAPSPTLYDEEEEELLCLFMT